MKTNVKRFNNEFGEVVIEWTEKVYCDGVEKNVVFTHVERHDHACRAGRMGTNGYWVYDYQGIELCKVCDSCKPEKLSLYRPEILSGYDQSDVDEIIEPNY